MKYLFLCLLAFSLCTCAKGDLSRKELKSADTFIIGYTGGWGGGPGYKLEDGELYRSDRDRALGDAENIVREVAFSPLNDGDATDRVASLLADFPEGVFSRTKPKFNCPEQAYDGACPYLIVIRDGSFNAWTLSEEDPDNDFADYMRKVGQVLNEL